MSQHSAPTDLFSIPPLTKQEIEVLLGLIDLSVKHGGLSVASNAVVLSQKIQKAAPTLVPLEAPAAPLT